MVEKKEQLTLEGIDKILKIKAGMNDNRTVLEDV
jgi:hypothetical protein